jgi:hypothetical protein
MGTQADTLKRRISRESCQSIDIFDAFQQGLLAPDGGGGWLKSILGLTHQVEQWIAARSKMEAWEGKVTVFYPIEQTIRVERKPDNQRARGVWYWECHGPESLGGCGRLTAKLLRPAGCDESLWAPWQCARCLNVYFPRDRQRSTALKLLRQCDHGIRELQRLKQIIGKP